MLSHRSRRPEDLLPRVTLLTLAAFLPVAVGCTSNEYVIPNTELARLAATPPGTRGARVRVVQQLGDRRSEPVPVTVPATPPPPPELADEDTETDQGHAPDVRVDVSGGGSRGAPAGRVPWHGHAVGGGHVGGGVRAPAVGHVSGGGGGGGGGNGDAALIVILVVVAVVVAVGLVSSEGVRFDGFVAMSPAQPVHLRTASGQVATVPVADLSPEWAAQTVEATVMDDEGSGIERLDGVPLDRRGGVFKLDSGTIAFDVAGATAVGPAMQVQSGYFFTRRLGLLASLGLAGARGGQGLIPRHALSLELQAIPVDLGRVHLGLFASGGMALTETVVGQTATVVSGPAVGGGALAELDLTSRMALSLRAGASVAKLDQDWAPAGLVTAGVAVY